MNGKLNDFIRFVCKKIHVSIDDSNVEMLVQFIKFGVVGVSNTLLSYVLNVLVLLMLSSLEITWDYVLGNLVSFFLSVLWSFYWNNKYVFTEQEGEQRTVWKALLKTYISYGVTGIVLNNILSYIWIEIFNVSKFIAPIINLVISVPINFLLNKFWAFNNKW